MLFQFVGKAHLEKSQNRSVRTFKVQLEATNFNSFQPKMIKPILLLLVGMACLALLDQTNGEQLRAKPTGRQDCPNYYFICRGRMGKSRTEEGRICVTFRWNGHECKKTLSDRQLEGRCRDETRRGVTYVGYQQSTEQC